MLIALIVYFSLGAIFATWMLLPTFSSGGRPFGILLTWLLHTFGWFAMVVGMFWMAWLDVHLEKKWKNFDA